MVLQNFLWQLTGAITDKNMCQEEIAQLFKILGEETNPTIIKQLVDILKRYKDKPMEIFKKLDMWKSQPEMVENVRLVKKLGVYNDQECLSLDAKYALGYVINQDKKITM